MVKPAMNDILAMDTVVVFDKVVVNLIYRQMSTSRADLRLQKRLTHGLATLQVL